MALGEKVPELAYWTCLDDLFQGQVHPCVALDQVPVQGLSVFQLHKHGMALGTIQQAEGKLAFVCRS